MGEQAAGDGRLVQLLEDSLAGLAIRGLAVRITMNETTAALDCGTLPSGEAVTAETEMYAASLTKQLIGALVAMAGIRVRHLLHHLSGLPELPTTPENWPTDNAALLAALRATTLAPEPPGTRYAYSNVGYILLAELLATVYGRPVADVAAERLFTPLGLRRSRLGGPPRQMVGYADPPGTIGDGGWWTTVDDVHTWLVALNERRVPFDVRRIETGGHLEDGTVVPYGWGLGLREMAGERAVIHGGGWHGWVSQTRRVPVRQMAIALMTHSDDDQAVVALGERLAQGALGLA